MSNLGVPELLIIALVLVLLFGAKKLPEMARGVGRSLRIFKSETAKLREDDDDNHTVQAQAQAPAQPQPQPAQPQQIQAVPAPTLSAEEQARQLEEQAARLRASAASQADKRV
ncbi:Sec-independent protein translocase subunit TatA [Nonomuraea angiospora]|uniref:Sec-independent protein translocase subunit TatA n=1 Tax=Nonomuraea angiospora TaxID=46172 RepID=UPI0029B322D3|nr:Sec-independent protein translocase subunit TatA [Nonomuraea angiospora]MDX3109937.1 Sec-independent protein translocase subunit TatA [Nonomuraea angiospora]